MIGVSTLFTSLATIAIGIISVILMKNDEKRDKMQLQPLFSVIIDQYKTSERDFLDNEEYRIINVGQRTQGRPEVWHYSFLVITFKDQDKFKETQTRFCQIDDYFGPSFKSGDYLLNGTILRSGWSNNNYGRFYNLLMDANVYRQEHPNTSVYVEMQHYFKIEYKDLLGENHRVVRTQDAEINPDQLAEIIKKADTDAQGKSFSIKNLNLEELLRTFFPEEFSD